MGPFLPRIVAEGTFLAIGSGAVPRASDLAGKLQSREMNGRGGGPGSRLAAGLAMGTCIAAVQAAALATILPSAIVTSPTFLVVLWLAATLCSLAALWLFARR